MLHLGRSNLSEVPDSTHGKQKRIWQLFAVSGGGWGMRPAASDNHVRSRVPTYSWLPDSSARSAFAVLGCFFCDLPVLSWRMLSAVVVN